LIEQWRDQRPIAKVNVLRNERAGFRGGQFSKRQQIHVPSLAKAGAEKTKFTVTKNKTYHYQIMACIDWRLFYGQAEIRPKP
jgi:hypothetical protein